MTAGTAEGLHLDLHVGGRGKKERETETDRPTKKGSGSGLSILKP